MTSSLWISVLWPLHFHDSLILVELIFKSFVLGLGHLNLLLNEGWILVVKAETVAFPMLDQGIDCSIFLVVDRWPDTVLNILRLLPVYLRRGRFLALSLHKSIIL